MKSLFPPLIFALYQTQQLQIIFVNKDIFLIELTRKICGHLVYILKTNFINYIGFALQIKLFANQTYPLPIQIFLQKYFFLIL